MGIGMNNFLKNIAFFNYLGNNINFFIIITHIQLSIGLSIIIQLITSKIPLLIYPI